MKRLLLIIYISFFASATLADDLVYDDLVLLQPPSTFKLSYQTQGVKNVYYSKDNPAETILHHIRAFALHDLTELVKDYRSNSTLTFGPLSPPVPNTGNTYEAAGLTQIEDTFTLFFSTGLRYFSEMTITSASRIGNQFYQTFNLNNGCVGSDTFQVTGNTISKQTAFVVVSCLPE